MSLEYISGPANLAQLLDMDAAAGQLNTLRPGLAASAIEASAGTMGVRPGSR